MVKLFMNWFLRTFTKNGWYVEYEGTKYEQRAHYVNGKRHREDGPAVLGKNGDIHYYGSGKRHRVDGPAVTWHTGKVLYYLNDEYLSEADYWAIQGGEFGKALYERRQPCDYSSS